MLPSGLRDTDGVTLHIKTLSWFWFMSIALVMLSNHLILCRLLLLCLNLSQIQGLFQRVSSLSLFKKIFTYLAASVLVDCGMWALSLWSMDSLVEACHFSSCCPQA